MNILIVPNFWYHFGFSRTPGGIEKVVITQFQELLDQNHNVHMIAPSDFIENDERVVKLPIQSSEYVKMNDPNKKKVIQKWSDECNKIVKELIEREKIDIILSHCTKPIHFKSLLEFNIPIYHMFHGLPYAFDYGSMKEILISSQNHNVTFLFVSNYQRNKFLESFYEIEFQYTVLNPFISKRLPENRKNRNGKYCVVLRVQRSYKTNQLLKELSKLDIEVDLYGSINPSDKEYVDEFMSILNSNPKIQYQGLVDNELLVNELLPEYEACFSISANDAFGLFALESTLAGTPIISIGNVVGYDEYAPVVRVNKLKDLRNLDYKPLIKELKDNIDEYQSKCDFDQFRKNLKLLIRGDYEIVTNICN